MPTKRRSTLIHYTDSTDHFYLNISCLFLSNSPAILCCFCLLLLQPYSINNKSITNNNIGEKQRNSWSNQTSHYILSMIFMVIFYVRNNNLPFIYILKVHAWLVGGFRELEMFFTYQNRLLCMRTRKPHLDSVKSYHSSSSKEKNSKQL